MSADDNAPEQAREVEVLDAVIFEVLDVLDHWDRTGSSERAVQAIRLRERIQAALAPIRAAEREEAAREGERRGLLAAADMVDGQDSYGDGAFVLNAAAQSIRNRADGVTGRSAT